MLPPAMPNMTCTLAVLQHACRAPQQPNPDALVKVHHINRKAFHQALLHGCLIPILEILTGPGASGEMAVLYHFWSRFLADAFSTRAYSRFRSLAAQDAAAGARAGAECLLRLYGAALGRRWSAAPVRRLRAGGPAGALGGASAP